MDNDCSKTDLPKTLVDQGDDAKTAERAKVYGISLDQLNDQSLVVPPGRHVVIDGSGGKDRGFISLQPKSIDDVKRWIGVPDELAAKRECCGMAMSALPAIASAGDLRKLHAGEQLNVRTIADQYVNGDSRRVTAYKSLIGHVIDRATIAGAFLRQDIDIRRGSVLEVSRNCRILFARHIRIWQGGLLRIRGDARIDCVSIQGGVALDINFDPNLTLALGYFAAKESTHG